MRVDPRMIPHLKDMLDELEGNRLRVTLAPAKRSEANMIRVVEEENTTWYQQLCRRYGSSRERLNRLHDTKIKRANVVSTLRMLIAGRKTSSYLVPFLLSEAKRY